MRPKFLVIFLAFVAAIVFVLFLIRPSKLQTNSKQTPEYQSSPQQSRSELFTTNSNLTNSSSKNSQSEKVTNSNNSDGDRWAMMKHVAEEGNVAVRFYGMIIDQDSNALSGARVKLGVRHNIGVIPNSLEAARFAALSYGEQQKIQNPTIEVMSDANGRFQWADSSVTGDIVGVGTITKEGYEPEPGQYSCQAGSGNYDNPVVFKMWNTNIHEQLITGEKSFEIQPDGKPHVIDLMNGTIAETGDGDLRIWIRYTNQMKQGQLCDWSAGIEVLNGGFVEQPHGTVMYSAPVDGYTNSFILQQQIKGGQSGEIGDRSFYLLLKNGQEFGKMDINLYAPYGFLHPGLIRVSYAINPSGSRILR